MEQVTQELEGFHFNGYGVFEFLRCPSCQTIMQEEAYVIPLFIDDEESLGVFYTQTRPTPCCGDTVPHPIFFKTPQEADEKLEELEQYLQVCKEHNITDTFEVMYPADVQEMNYPTS